MTTTVTAVTESVTPVTVIVIQSQLSVPYPLLCCARQGTGNDKGPNVVFSPLHHQQRSAAANELRQSQTARPSRTGSAFQAKPAQSGTSSTKQISLASRRPFSLPTAPRTRHRQTMWRRRTPQAQQRNHRLRPRQQRPQPYQPGRPQRHPHP